MFDEKPLQIYIRGSGGQSDHHHSPFETCIVVIKQKSPWTCIISPPVFSSCSEIRKAKKKILCIHKNQHQNFVFRHRRCRLSMGLCTKHTIKYSPLYVSVLTDSMRARAPNENRSIENNGVCALY